MICCKGLLKQFGKRVWKYWKNHLPWVVARKYYKHSTTFSLCKRAKDWRLQLNSAKAVRNVVKQML